MKNIDSLGKELSRNVKTQEEMTDVLGQLLKSMMENILNAEMDSHLGYEKNEKAAQRREFNRCHLSLKFCIRSLQEEAVITIYPSKGKFQFIKRCGIFVQSNKYLFCIGD